MREYQPPSPGPAPSWAQDAQHERQESARSVESFLDGWRHVDSGQGKVLRASAAPDVDHRRDAVPSWQQWSLPGENSRGCGSSPSAAGRAESWACRTPKARELARGLAEETARSLALEKEVAALKSLLLSHPALVAHPALAAAAAARAAHSAERSERGAGAAAPDSRPMEPDLAATCGAPAPAAPASSWPPGLQRPGAAACAGDGAPGESPGELAGAEAARLRSYARLLPPPPYCCPYPCPYCTREAARLRAYARLPPAACPCSS